MGYYPRRYRIHTGTSSRAVRFYQTLFGFKAPLGTGKKTTADVVERQSQKLYGLYKGLFGVGGKPYPNAPIRRVGKGIWEVPPEVDELFQELLRKFGISYRRLW